MKYSRVFIESFGYELAPVVVTSAELEARLAPLYETLHIPMGQLEALTGIIERRWWEPGYSLSHGAELAARKAIDASPYIDYDDIEILIYGGVCREGFEPATACHVAAGMGMNRHVTMFDISNACLGVLNGILEIANRIELGQIRAGMVVSCESAREINDTMINRMLKEPNMELFKTSLATLTGGSGAIAVLLTDGSFSNTCRRRLIGGVVRAAPEHNDICHWNVAAGKSPESAQIMMTDSVSVLKYGVQLGLDTWCDFLKEIDLERNQIDRVICHQVGSGHKNSILKRLEISEDKDYTTYAHLGNIGTVSLPITAALADERGILEEGDSVAFLGIGSGLNCLMLGWEW